MAETVFACKEVEKLALENTVPGFAADFAEFPYFPKDRFVCDGPGNTGDGDRQDK